VDGSLLRIKPTVLLLSFSTRNGKMKNLFATSSLLPESIGRCMS
jgi:hypothetical protein